MTVIVTWRDLAHSDDDCYHLVDGEGVTTANAELHDITPRCLSKDVSYLSAGFPNNKNREKERLLLLHPYEKVK